MVAQYNKDVNLPVTDDTFTTNGMIILHVQIDSYYCAATKK